MLARVVSALTVTTMLMSAPVSAADESADKSYGQRDLRGWTDNLGVAAEANVRGPSSRSVLKPARRSVGAPACSSSSLSPDASFFMDHFAIVGLTGFPRSAEPGRWVLRKCVDAQGAVTSNVRWVPRLTAGISADALLKRL